MSANHRLHRYPPSSHLLLYYLVIDRQGIIDRFPQADRKSYPIPTNITEFCHFSNIMKFDPLNPEAKFFTFATVSSNGATLYGACLRVFQSITNPDGSTSYIPKILMVLSEWNYFSAFEVFLGYFYLASRRKHDNPSPPKVPIENYLIQLEDTQLPSDQGQQIVIRFGCDLLPITRRSRFIPPALNASYNLLFDRLSIPVVALILQNILCEKQIVFVSDDISVLMPVQELILSLIHPLRWHHLYLPLAPRSFTQRLVHYKHPFIMGTSKDIFDTVAPINALSISLDDGSVMSGEESQLYHCEEIERLCSVLEDHPKTKSEIYQFQCRVLKAIIDLLQNTIQSKSCSNVCAKSLRRQIRTSLAGQLFVAEYRRYVPGDLRLSNLQSYFDLQLNLPRMEKVEQMFEPKIYPKETRDYARLYQSQIVPISTKRINQTLKRTNLGQKFHVHVKENDGQQLNQTRRRKLCNGSTVVAADFCCNKIAAKCRTELASKNEEMPLKSWLAQHENAEIAKSIRPNPLNINAVSVNSSVDSGKWASNSSDSQSVGCSDYVKEIEIDNDSIQKLETRIQTQNDSNSEKEADIFEGISESDNDHDHDCSTIYSFDSKKETITTLHCLQERNEFDTNSLREQFAKDESSHASLFAEVPKGKLEDLFRPESVSKALSLGMFLERAKNFVNCTCNAIAIKEQG